MTFAQFLHDKAAWSEPAGYPKIITLAVQPTRTGVTVRVNGELDGLRFDVRGNTVTSLTDSLDNPL